MPEIRASQSASRAMATSRTADIEKNEICGIAWLQNDKNRSLPSNVPGASRPDLFYSQIHITKGGWCAEA